VSTTVSTPQATGDRVIFETMGTVGSLMVPGDLPADLARRVVSVFNEMDERFSLYKPESEASRVSRRELAFSDASSAYRSAYWVAHDWGTLTDGAFHPYRHDGTIDLNGVVKALAIDAAAELLGELPDWCLNVGGDLVARGHDAEGRPWVAGIVDPDDQHKLASQALLTDELPAIATSGTALRGEHIWRLPQTHQFRQVTVQARDIVTADVLATAIMAGGRQTLQQMLTEHQLEVLAFGQTDDIWATPAFRG
jgi:FAD:protein FMN transferase